MCNNGYHIVRTELVDESLHLRNLYNGLSRRVPIKSIEGSSRFLREDVLRHSVEIELAGMREPEKRKVKKSSERALINAFDYANRAFNGELTDDYIQEIGHRVDVISNPYGYRRDNVRIQGGRRIPPAWEKIEREMEGFLFENSCIDEPLEKAIHAHLHIARIHPFMDGNGRTARLVQNAILERSGYVPIITLVTEREKYMDLIGNAVDSYCDKRARTEDSPENQEFKRYLEKSHLTLREIAICKGLALKIAMQRNNPEVREFYNYMAEKEVRQLRQICDKLLGAKK